MEDRTFNESWAWQAPNGVLWRFRRNREYKIPKDCAAYADKHGFTKKVKAAAQSKAVPAAEENKALAGAPENKY